MSTAGIFIVGTLITLVVFAAFGILTYGIVLDRRDLVAAERERLGPDLGRPNMNSALETDAWDAAALVLD